MDTSMGSLLTQNQYGHGVNTGTGSTQAWEHRHGNNMGMRLWARDQHGHGNMGTGSTWAQDQLGHWINTGMGTWAWDSSMQQLFSSQGSGGRAPGKSETRCQHRHGNMHRIEPCSNYFPARGPGAEPLASWRPSAAGME